MIDRLQPLLKKYSSKADFLKQYNVTGDELDAFVQYAAKTIQEISAKDMKISEGLIKTLIKANAARFKWGNSAYYQVLNQDDNTFKKAITL